MASLYDDIAEPDYDHLNVLTYDMKVDDDDDLKKGLKKGGKDQPQVEDDYILGTLVVRVVAARDLTEGGGSFLRSKQINPYASVNFCSQTQRTSAVHSTADPLWPRAEAMYMDVALPLSLVTYQDDPTSPVEDDDDENHVKIPEPTVTISLFHASGEGGLSKYPSKKNAVGDSDDPFLGTASIDVTPLLTGKKLTIDKWLPLRGTNHTRGTVRIVCEYETSDPPPRMGDIVRLTRFCKARDLYPVPIKYSYRVQEVDRDDIVLEYTTPEGWICTFVAHRYMVICQERHQAVLELAENELSSITHKLAYSPIVKELELAVERVPDEGLLFLGLSAVQGAGSLLDRWLKGGVDTALGDLQYATNWDGRFTETVNLGTDVAPASSTLSTSASVAERLAVIESDDDDDVVALPGMPCCPITGEPMLDPVVAADGHTYERKAISRWFQESDKSPLTGSLLPHKNLVPNYMLLSSLQDAATKATPIKKDDEGKSMEAVSVAEKTKEDNKQEEAVDDRKMPAM